MRVFKLKFHSALHVDARGSGEPEVAEEFIRSDTLSAALCIAWSDLYPVERPSFFLEPPFKVGSAFPYAGESLLFPKPVWPVLDAGDDYQRKTLKKVRWVSSSIFSRAMDGRGAQFDEIELPGGSAAVLKEETRTRPELAKPPFWVVGERQRVTVDRLGNPENVRPFFFALQFFAPGCGLWFPADADSPNMEKLRRALDYLGDCGLGADRNSGLGHFKVEKEADFEFSSGKKKDGWLTLSLFNPSPEEDLERLTSPAAYDLTTRSGWVHMSTSGRPPVRAFAEGSYFSQKPVGRVVEMLDKETIDKFQLGLSHTAPRDFRAVCLPCAEPPYLKGGNA